MASPKEMELLREWQNRLGLTDWTIALSTGLFELSLEDAAGCTSYVEVTKSAAIEIIDKRVYGTRIIPYDFEKILVHELLHLKFCLLFDNDDSLQSRLVHQLIDDLARALVDAKRRR